jgi:thiol:disulfide interchange protein DsbD
MTKILLTILIYCGILWGSATAMAEPLPAEQAFALTAFMDKKKELVLQWNIAPGYYLYRDQITVVAAQDGSAKIGAISMPEGQEKRDDLHGIFQSYTGLLTVHIPVASPQRGQLHLNIAYQGCSAAGFCYPPVKDNLTVNLLQITGPQDLTDNIVGDNMGVGSKVDPDYVTRLLMGHNLFIIALGFLGLGVLLGFTPCVLPMVPILSSIIVGCGNDIGTRKAFLLSLAYVIGMAWSYANGGMIVALLGSHIQTELQQPWVIVLFSGLFVVLALSLFGLFEARLPTKLHQRLSSWSQRHQGGTYVGVFFMGGFSTLVVSPCISAPLVGVLSYIADSGSVLLGGVALLALGFGMGLPLLLIGTSAGKILPTSGAWMEKIKHVFGFMMLGMAIWMLGRVLPNTVILILWALLIMFMGICISRLQRTQKTWRTLHQGMGLILLSGGLILLGSVAVEKFSINTVVEQSPFVTVKNMEELDAKLAQAKQDKKQVMLDFYADWCATCLRMDQHVFNQQDVLQALHTFVWVRADVTKNNEFDRALMKRYHVIAPPTIVFFDSHGNYSPRAELVGDMNAKEFLAQIEQSGGPQIKLCQSNPNAC